MTTPPPRLNLGGSFPSLGGESPPLAGRSPPLAGISPPLGGRSPPLAGISPPSQNPSNLRLQCENDIERLSQKVTTHLPDGKTAEVYIGDNMRRLQELYDNIKYIPWLSLDLEKRIKNILAEYKTTSAEIVKKHGIGFLKPVKAPNSRNMRKSRKTVKGRKSRKTKKSRK